MWNALCAAAAALVLLQHDAPRPAPASMPPPAPLQLDARPAPSHPLPCRPPARPAQVSWLFRGALASRSLPLPLRSGRPPWPAGRIATPQPATPRSVPAGRISIRQLPIRSATRKRDNILTVRHRRHCLLCDPADIVCCATQQTMSAASHSTYCLMCDTAEAVLLCRTADNVCCVTQPRFSAACHCRHCRLLSHSRQCLPLHNRLSLLCDAEADSEAGTTSSKLPDCLPLLAEVSSRVQGIWDVAMYIYMYI